MSLKTVRILKRELCDKTAVIGFLRLTVPGGGLYDRG